MPEIFDDSSKQPVPVQDIYNAYEVARLLGISKNKVWELSKRGNDPLPLRRMEGQKKGSIAFRAELLDWAMRNSSKIASGRRCRCMRRENCAPARRDVFLVLRPSCGRSSGSRHSAARVRAHLRILQGRRDVLREPQEDLNLPRRVRALRHQGSVRAGAERTYRDDGRANGQGTG